ncbi:pheromone processing endoprotease [Umbelopsis nana]
MVRLSVLALLAVGFQLGSAARPVPRNYAERLYYTLHSPSGDSDAAEHTAQLLNARFEGKVGELNNYFLISVDRPSLSARSDLDEYAHTLAAFEALQNQSLDKRSSSSIRAISKIESQAPRRRLVKRAPIESLEERQDPPVNENLKEEEKANAKKITWWLEEPGAYLAMKKELGIKDVGFDNQWHLVNREQQGNDLNITGVWQQGITGEGVVVVLLDDGLDYESDDLKDNFFAEGSYDFNDHTDLPKPRLIDDNHGTRCAGEIAAVKNEVCGLGVAYNAKVAGVRILSAEISEADEAEALNYKYQENDIYSCSWGPPDNGEVVDAPKGIVYDAIVNGINNGRNGNGTIFVFASGNGGSYDDNCNFDGYTNSMYTITVGAVDRLGKHPYYAERCSAQLVVTYSSGSASRIYTTDVGTQSCTDSHGGTSAAAPLAAGVFALVLSVRPDLTWRDMQYLCVKTAVPVALDDEDWTKLPTGRMFNHRFGYGSLDAYRIVEEAKTHENLRAQTHLAVPLDTKQPRPIPDLTGDEDTAKALTSVIDITAEMVRQAGLSRLEHVTVNVDIEHERRGDLEILIESPHNVTSQLAARRRFDLSNEGFANWTFMTVKHWDEDPVGNWTLRVIDAFNPGHTGKLVHWTLTLWGEIAADFSGEPNYQPPTGVSSTEAIQSETSTTTIETASPSTSMNTSSSVAETGTTAPAADSAQTSGTGHIDEQLEVSQPPVNGTNVPEHIVSSGSTIAYISVGSILILAAASIAYVAKRKSWADKGYKEQPMLNRTEGYEFDLFADDDSEAEDDDIDDDGSHAGSPMLGRDKGKGRMVESEGQD